MNEEKPVKSVLFVCNMNQIRSPMAEYLLRNIAGGKIYAQSAGIMGGNKDGFMQAVMLENDIDVLDHTPETLEELEDTFVDLVITLTQNAKDQVDKFFKDQAVEIEHWDIANPSDTTGKREDILLAYRATRDELESVSAIVLSSTESQACKFTLFSTLSVFMHKKDCYRFTNIY